MVFMGMGGLIYQSNSLLGLGAAFPLGLWLLFPFHSNYKKFLVQYFPSTTEQLFTKGVIFANGSLNSL